MPTGRSSNVDHARPRMNVHRLRTTRAPCSTVVRGAPYPDRVDLRWCPTRAGVAPPTSRMNRRRPKSERGGGGVLRIMTEPDPRGQSGVTREGAVDANDRAT